MINVNLDKAAGVLDISNELFAYRLTRAAAGFPSRIGFQGEAHPLCDRQAPWLGATLGGKRRIHPAPLKDFKPALIRARDSVRVVFDNISWCDDAGKILEGYRLALHYEIYADGVVFVKTFFFTENLHPGVIRDFVLEPSLALDGQQSADWAYWDCPKTNTADLIQSLGGYERNLAARGERRFAGRILPFVSFDFGREERRDRHLEYFVESFNSLTADFHNTETVVSWKGTRANLCWNFQKSPRAKPGRAYYWGNIWGWALRRFPVERRHTPFRIFHYLDNFDRYPTEKIIRQATAEGANLFMLHENWRLDAKNSEFIYDRSVFNKVLASIHRHGMRAAFYVRGNEDGVKEDLAGSILPLLRKNWDGLYMDFGTPYCIQTADEMAPGGRIQFRDYYYQSRRLREQLGPDGVHISHSGSFFSAVGHTTVDGYLAGEQEKGQMIRDKRLHAYFSGLSVAPSYLWTAAFPSYRTKAALPYLASTAQSPFVILGTQFPSSSLAHPNMPATITFQRPLWRLWELLDGKRDIRVHSSQGSERIFKTDSDKTGACLMADRDNNVLLIAANYAATKRRVSLAVDWDRLQIRPGRRAYALDSNYERNTFAAVPSTAPLAREMEGYGLAGWLFVNQAAEWQKRLAFFARPYASFPADEKEYAARIEAIRRRRFQPPVWDTCYMRAIIPNFPNNYEESIWWDLFDNTIQLQERPARGKPVVLGYLGRQGLLKAAPAKKDYIVPGTWTPWIPLHKLVRRKRTGHVPLCLATKRQVKYEFYNFLCAELSPVPGRDARQYAIEYNLEIDSDWSLLPFNISLKD